MEQKVAAPRSPRRGRWSQRRDRRCLYVACGGRERRDRVGKKGADVSGCSGGQERVVVRRPPFRPRRRQSALLSTGSGSTEVVP
ncbi:hypothetical protein E2562_007418 [Oryza meyeriana var. granulata]|uniref:Uncharacterized protein n=1 Tax=Oryza meyeriana var. granulata TaxID=110450 RepID=A0A6G1CYC6_9ORYZ|nr:hypothetical protein E2562_007418 [Oryza meyeriana var. granulata]